MGGRETHDNGTYHDRDFNASLHNVGNVRHLKIDPSFTASLAASSEQFLGTLKIVKQTEGLKEMSHNYGSNSTK
jgi:hypothetical protein